MRRENIVICGSGKTGKKGGGDCFLTNAGYPKMER